MRCWGISGSRTQCPPCPLETAAPNHGEEGDAGGTAGQNTAWVLSKVQLANGLDLYMQLPVAAQFVLVVSQPTQFYSS